MSARIGEPGDDLIVLADDLINVIVKIGERSADPVHVLFELLDAYHGGSDRAPEYDASRDEFFESRPAPRIPEVGVIPADQGFVVEHGRKPPAPGDFPPRCAPRPILAPLSPPTPRLIP